MLREVYKVSELSEVFDILSKYGKESRIIAGGTDLMVDIRLGRHNPEIIIDITDIKEMSNITYSGETVDIGAAVTVTQIVESSIFEGGLASLKKAAESIGSPQIRNRATIGGNICNGSSAADMVPPLMALDSILIINSPVRSREVLLEDFYLEKGLDLHSSEVLFGIRFKALKNNQSIGFSKLGLRKALAISRISVSVFIELDDRGYLNDIRIASGALGPHPLRERDVEAFLKGKPLSEENIKKGSRLLSNQVNRRLEGRSSREFKKEAVQGVFKTAIENALNTIKAGEKA